MLPCGWEGQWYPGVHEEEHVQQVKEGDPTPLLSPSEATSEVLCPVWGSSVQERQGPTDKTQMNVWSIFLARKGWGSWACLAWRSKSWEVDFINVYKRRCQEHGARLFSVVPSAMKRANRLKLNTESSTWRKQQQQGCSSAPHSPCCLDRSPLMDVWEGNRTSLEQWREVFWKFICV